ncbi:MAG: YgjP-like metallopeptidase domain-containing protein, partial [Oscillospiraceae bacterium]
NYNKNIIKNFTIENNILLFGKIYKTRLCEKNTKISFNEVSFFLPSYEFSEIKSELKKTYKKQLSPILEEMVEKYYKKLSQSTTLIGISKPAFKINSAQTRWGSCSCKKDVVSGVVFSTKFSLNFSFMLAMLDFEEIEAIVAHEICHILIPNHSKDFYDILLKIFPEYNEIEKKLSIDQKQPHLQIWKEN